MRLSLVRLGCVLLGAVVIGWLALQVDWPAARSSLSALGARAPLIALPYVLVACCDTFGWRATFEHVQAARAPLLFRMRVATDAVVNSLPGGVALGEALKIVLLKRCLHMPVTEGIANVAISKLSLGVSQALFVIFGVLLAATDLARHSVELIGRRGLAQYALLGAVLLLVIMVSIAAAIQSGVLVRFLERLQRGASEPWRARLLRLEIPLARIDHGLAVARRVPGLQVVGSIALFFIGYVFLGFEDWLILHLLGANVSFERALSLEAIVSVVRVLFFFIPSGLGALEVGYYGLLKLYGVPEAETMAAAFALVKRLKEVSWIVLGYGLLAGLPARVSDVRPS